MSPEALFPTLFFDWTNLKQCLVRLVLEDLVYEHFWTAVYSLVQEIGVLSFGSLYWGQRRLELSLLVVFVINLFAQRVLLLLELLLHLQTGLLLSLFGLLQVGLLQIGLLYSIDLLNFYRLLALNKKLRVALIVKRNRLLWLWDSARLLG